MAKKKGSWYHLKALSVYDLLAIIIARFAWHEFVVLFLLLIFKTKHMAIRKDGVNQNLEERNRSTEFNRVNDEDHLDTRDISHDIEEGDEDYDDEEMENEELTEEDFEIDGDEEDEEEIE